MASSCWVNYDGITAPVIIKISFELLTRKMRANGIKFVCLSSNNLTPSTNALSNPRTEICNWVCRSKTIDLKTLWP